ncbi:hypothetical protein BKA70DRAFT_1456159, partial [Coprinopsis sp. MPI-PUGE-AT-0042]
AEHINWGDFETPLPTFPSPFHPGRAWLLVPSSLRMSTVESVIQIVPSSPFRKQLDPRYDPHESQALQDAYSQLPPPVPAFPEICLLTGIQIINDEVKASRIPSSRPTDDYERIAGVCALFLIRTFRCSQTTDDVSLAHGATQLPKLPSFIAQLLYTSGLPNGWALDAMGVLKLLRAKAPQTERMKLSGHRLFLAAFILVAKEKAGGQLIFGYKRIGNTRGGREVRELEDQRDEKRRKKEQRSGASESKVMKDLWWSAISGFAVKTVEEMQSQLLQHLN